MNFFKSKLILSCLFSAAAFTTAAHAAEANPLAAVAKSTNIKAALIQACKDETTKGSKGKLSATEVSKLCTCQVEAQGKVTEAQKWEIQSTINAKKNPASLAFVQKQNKDLQTCLGTSLVAKLAKLSDEARQAAAQAPKK